MGGNAWVGCLSDDVQKYLQQEGFYVSEVNRYSPRSRSKVNNATLERLKNPQFHLDIP